MDGRTDGRMDGQAGGWTDRRADGLMDGRMDGWTDGRMNHRNLAIANATSKFDFLSNPYCMSCNRESAVPVCSWRFRGSVMRARTIVIIMAALPKAHLP